VVVARVATNVFNFIVWKISIPLEEVREGHFDVDVHALEEVFRRLGARLHVRVFHEHERFHGVFIVRTVHRQELFRAHLYLHLRIHEFFETGTLSRL